MSDSLQSPRLFRRRLAALLLLAAMLRLALIVFAEANPQRFDYPDSHRYLRVARHIGAGDGPIESPSIRAGTDPLYPYLLALPIRLGATSDAAVFRAARVLHLAAGLILIWLTAAVARRWFSDGTALIAAALLAVDPITLFFHGLVLTEIVYTAMLVAAMLAILRLSGERPFAWAAVAGVVLGLATVTRSTSLLLPLFVLPFAWHFTRGGVARKAAIALVLLAGFVATLTPSVARNYELFDRLIPARIGGGASLMEALGPWADGGPGMDRIIYPPVDASANEAERDAVYRRAAVDWARAHPGEVVSLAWAKLRRMWSITVNAPGYESSRFTAIGWLTVAPVFALALVGAWRLRRQPGCIAFLLLPAAYYSLIHMVFVGSVRYRLPAMPFVMILAAVGLAACLRLDPPRRSA